MGPHPALYDNIGNIVMRSAKNGVRDFLRKKEWELKPRSCRYASGTLNLVCLEVRYNYLQTDINGERDENGNLNGFNLQMAIS